MLKLSLVLFLSFLIGLEREEMKRGGRKTFGGVRTFPLIGLLAYALAFIAQGQILPMLVGFAVVGCFMFLSYWHKLRYSTEAGITTEMSGLIVYLAADLIYLNHLWIAVTTIVADGHHPALAVLVGERFDDRQLIGICHGDTMDLGAAGFQSPPMRAGRHR